MDNKRYSFESVNFAVAYINSIIATHSHKVEDSNRYTILFRNYSVLGEILVVISFRDNDIRYPYTISINTGFKLKYIVDYFTMRGFLSPANIEFMYQKMDEIENKLSELENKKYDFNVS